MNEKQFEMANKLAEQAIADGIEAAKDALKPNNVTHCLDCDIMIPLERQQALANSATRCVECQGDL